MAQTNTNLIKTPEVVQASPEAAGITKFGDIPVGEYTGTPDISIPLYVAKSGKLQLPVSLSYHASGIQVSQEATWVGLGWNLLAGGCITYVPVGANDQVSFIQAPWDDWLKLFTYEEGYNVTPNIGHEDGMRLWGHEGLPICYCCDNNDLSQTKDQVLLACQEGQGERDIYSANFAGYSFKFILIPKYQTVTDPDDRIPVLVGNKNKCKIECAGWNFKITGEDGTFYYFTASETANSGLSIFTNWYLTQIISPEGDLIKLIYSNGSTGLIPALSERYSTGGFQESTRTVSSLYTFTNNKYLDSIETKSEIIKFITSGREDISGSGARKLDTIKVIDRFTNTIRKTYVFNYDYFTGTLTGGNYLNDDNFWNFVATQMGLTENNLKKRLKLLSLTQYDTLNNKNEKYNFSYYDTVPLPYKTSFSRDYWGYFNGANNLSNLMPNSAAHTIMPNILPLSLDNNNYNNIPPFFWEYNGASRGANSDYLTAGMLKSITYPTGGKTIFEFEPHTFDNHKYLSVASENIVLANKNYTVQDNNNPTPSHVYDTLTLHSTELVHIWARIRGIEGSFGLNELLPAFIKITGPWGSSSATYTYHLDPAIDANFNANGYLKTWDEYLSLPAGHYTFTCDFPDNLGNLGYAEPPVVGILTYKDYNPSLLSAQQPIGGGVRIKTITNYDENNNIVSTKKYYYKNENGTTSGKMLAPLNFLRIRDMVEGEVSGMSCPKTYITVYSVSADSYIPPSCAIVGTNVGYDRVEIESTSGSINNGKEIKYFVNQPATMFDDIPLFGNSTNGDLSKRILLNVTNDTIKKEEFNYSLADNERVTLNTIVEDLYRGPLNNCTDTYATNTCPYNGRFRIGVYPNYSFRNQLIKKVETDYLNGTKVTKSIENSYDPDNYAVRESREIKSDNRIHYIKYQYPHDFMNQSTSDGLIYWDLVDRNIISPVIVKTDSTENSLMSKLKTNYFYFGDQLQFLAPNSVEFQSGSNPSEIRLNYDKYDNAGNIQQFHKADDINNSFIWGYNNSLPVIKAENITYTNLSSALSSVTSNLDQLLKDVGTLSNDSQKNTWRTFNSSLRNSSSLAGVMITTYTYDPLYGITSVTDPGGIITYYEYDSFGRLKLIRDQNNKILKEFSYHYRGQQ